MIPKGKIMIIGGAENKGENDPELRPGEKPHRYELLSCLLPRDLETGHIEVITAAAKDPEILGQTYISAYKKSGYTKVSHMRIQTAEDAQNPEYLHRLERAHAVLFSGGDQERLGSVLAGSAVADTICRRYFHDEQFTVAGTSAGAMALTKLMICEGGYNKALRKGDVRISDGLGLLEDCIVDTHFTQRGRFGRLALSVMLNPGCLGIGLPEDTALLVRHGNEAECCGSGMVILIDGGQIGYSNISDADERTPVSVENLLVHILSKGTKFLLHEREFIPEHAAVNQAS